MRDMVRSYFAKALDGYVARLNDTGWPDQQLELLKQELDVHEDAKGGFDDLSDLYLDAGTVVGFRASAGLSDAEWFENAADLRRKLREARRAQITEFLSRAESLEGFSFSPSQDLATPPQARSASLGDAYADFMAEHHHWSDQMTKKARGFLAVLLEYFGQDRLMADITRNDASELKKVVQSLPVNRKT